VKANRIAAAVAAMMLVSAPAAMAIDLKLPGTKAAPAEGGGADAVAMQEGLVQNYAQSAAYINAAQAELAAAFGLKERAAELQAEAAALQGGATLDKDAIKKNRELTNQASAEIDAKIAEGADLNDEGRKHYVASLTPFGKGVSSAAKLPAEASSFSDTAQAQLKSASLTEKASVTSKLAAGSYLAKEIPGFSKSTFDSFKKIVTYAQTKGIPVPKDATAALGM
jgi:hypothetical protein